MSLLRIALKDFVIIDQLALELDQGFTVLTGETGAGKSILIDALQLVLGGRAEAALVREGQAKADVSAEFEATPAVDAWLDQAGLEREGSTLLLRRVVDNQGRSRGWVNGTPATATQLRDLGSLLVDIHGQHAWQGLMKPESNRDLLDAYGGIDTRALRRAWDEWQQTRAKLAQAETQASAAEDERERLGWLLSEANKLAPQPEEWAALQEEHARLANVVALTEAAQAALNFLSEAETHAVGLLNRAQQVLKQRVHQDSRLAPVTDTLAQASLLAEEATRDLQSYLRHTEADPGRLAELELRLGQWLALAKRLRCSPEVLPDELAALNTRWQALEAASDIEGLKQRCSESEATYQKKSKEISALRHTAKAQLAIEITNLLQHLGMQGGVFDVEISALERPTASGCDHVEFVVAGHPGATPKPVMRIASGGELSRIALAVSVSTSQLGKCPTLIFDEVDAGIGGAVAHKVGQLLASLGEHRQVLAVTHLAQVAARAHHHLRVTKHAGADTVSSEVVPLSAAERVAETARMLGGGLSSEKSLAHAKEMLEHG